MPPPDQLPVPVPDTLPARLSELADLVGGDSPRSRKFLGGLVIGALAGAALVGSLAARRQPARRAAGQDRPDA
jgi:hypothetical protein